MSELRWQDLATGDADLLDGTSHNEIELAKPDDLGIEGVGSQQ